MKFSSRNELGQARKKGTVADEDPFRACGARKQKFRVEIIQKYKRYAFLSLSLTPTQTLLLENPCGDFPSLLSSPRLSHIGAPPESPAVASRRRSLPLLFVAVAVVVFERNPSSKSGEICEEHDPFSSSIPDHPKPNPS